MRESEPLFERHVTVGQLAREWHMSPARVRLEFRDEPGVIKYGTGHLTRGRKRTHVSLRIPESVARRVYRRITGKELSSDRKDVA